MFLCCWQPQRSATASVLYWIQKVFISLASEEVVEARFFIGYINVDEFTYILINQNDRNLFCISHLLFSNVLRKVFWCNSLQVTDWNTQMKGCTDYLLRGAWGVFIFSHETPNLRGYTGLSSEYILLSENRITTPFMAAACQTWHFIKLSKFEKCFIFTHCQNKPFSPPVLFDLQLTCILPYSKKPTLNKSVTLNAVFLSTLSWIRSVFENRNLEGSYST